MRPSDLLQLFKSPELRAAWLIAIVADGIQILILPLFVAGALSPVDVVIDVCVAVLLSRLLGWHWAFLPTIIAELVPALDLFPTWTLAVLFVSWQRRHSMRLEVIEKRVGSRRFLRS